MNQHRDDKRPGLLAAIAVAALLEGVYLACLFARNASAFRDVRAHWASDLARESGTAGVVWLGLVAGVAALIVSLLMRSRSVSLLLALEILMGCLGLESLGVLERIKFNRMGESMTNLRDVGLEILKKSKSSNNALPLKLAPRIVSESIFRDGWGHPLRYVRISSDQAFLIAPGSDARCETNPETIKRETFPPSRFDHDIIVEITQRNVDFTVHPDGPAQGIPCTIYAAFGCLYYSR